MSDAESWTRRVLEAEARKRGIRDPEARSRLELARLILAHDYTSTRSTRRMLGKLIGEAAAKLPKLPMIGAAREPEISPAEERRRQAARADERRASAPNAAAARGVPAAASGGVAPASDAGDAKQGPALTPQTGSTLVPPADETQALRLAEAPALAPSPLDPTFAPPPFEPTLAPPPLDPTLAPPPLDSTLAPPPLDSTPAPPPLTAAASSLQPSAADENRLNPARRDARALHLSWQVTEQGAERARVLLGMRGELALRIVSVRADEAHVVHSEVTDHGPIEPSGEWTAQLASDDAHCVAAVGLRSAGRFVSIVHRSSAPRTPASSER
jgi:hypothetical protein